MNDVVKEKSFVATSARPSARLALEWFAVKGFPRRANNKIEPLINGEAAFGAVAAAIQSATKTIDVVSWGFDASMRLKRPGGERLGELLKRKGSQGVKVRVLIWRNPIVQAMENTVPGANQFSGQGLKDLSMSGVNRMSPPSQVADPAVAAKVADQQRQRIEVKRLEAERTSRMMSLWGSPGGAQAARDLDAEYGPRIQAARERAAALDREIAELRKTRPGTYEDVGYGKGPSGKIANSAGAPGDPAAARFNREWHEMAQAGDLTNVEFRTRDFDAWDRVEIAWRQWFESVDKTPWTQMAAMCLLPSHHQKMILVDYEQPDRAVGFVMGHNLHNNYWDTSDHHYNDLEGLRVPGFGPWQDLSTKVHGAVLCDLNANFCSAWDKGSPWYQRWFDSLTGDRDHLQPHHFATKPAEMRSLAQICRTQPDEGGEQGIRELYLRAAGNARKYVYVENQYFRYPPWAEELKKMRRGLLATGRSEAEHGVCHVFVVTNVPDSLGRMRTAEMLTALGRRDRVPTIARKQSGMSADQTVTPSDVAGLRIHVCTLVSDTRKPSNNASRPIYVHSKLLVVDDAFFTLGSANVNTRSMESDSELNIASDDSTIAKHWRESLFSLHTGRAPYDDIAAEFMDWRDVLDKNSTALKNGEPIQGQVIELFDGGNVTQAFD